MASNPSRGAAWLPWAIVLVVAMAVPAGAWISQARAQAVLPDTGPIRFSAKACEQLGALVRVSAAARDDGIQARALRRVVDGFMMVYAIPEGMARIIRLEVGRVFTSTRRPEQLEQDLYTRCLTGPLGGTEA
jgi:hypothetical protein